MLCQTEVKTVQLDGKKSEFKATNAIQILWKLCSN